MTDMDLMYEALDRMPASWLETADISPGYDLSGFYGLIDGFRGIIINLSNGVDALALICYHNALFIGIAPASEIPMAYDDPCWRYNLIELYNVNDIDDRLAKLAKVILP